MVDLSIVFRKRLPEGKTLDDRLLFPRAPRLCRVLLKKGAEIMHLHIVRLQILHLQIFRLQILRLHILIIFTVEIFRSYVCRSYICRSHVCRSSICRSCSLFSLFSLLEAGQWRRAITKMRQLRTK